jgi:uncharacterized phage protein gp47/JayE
LIRLISYSRDADRISADMEHELRTNTPITNFYKGGRARGLVRAFASVLSSLYTSLDDLARRVFLSTAEGDDLNSHGYLLNVERLPNETDLNYRTRIANSLLSHAKGSETAIMDAVFAVPGVEAAQIVRYPRGPGSFEVMIFTERYETLASVVAEVQNALRDQVAEGIRWEARGPRILGVSLKVRIVLHADASEPLRQVREEVRQVIRTYIDAIPAGESFIANQLINSVMSASPAVADLEVTSMTLGEPSQTPTPVFFENYATRWDEKLYVLDINRIEVI